MASPDAADDVAAPASVSSATGRSSVARSVNDSALVCAMLSPRKVTARASSRSPVPWHDGHRTLRTKRRALSRIIWLFVSASVWRMCLRALQKVPW